MENKILYITQPGILSRKDNTLFFENENTKKIIPIIGIEQILCLCEVSVNTKLLQYLTENKITLHFFNYHKYYTGTYYPRESYVSGKLFIKQVEYYQDNIKRCSLAKEFVIGITENMIELLIHYQRHEKDVGNHIKALKENIIGINKKSDINQLLMIEGMSRDIFYQSFRYFLPEDFVLNKRIRKPPDNPMNALISFGNSVLYTCVLSKIYHTQLNPTISYLHEPFERRFSLALDIAEVFKLPLVFSNIFNLINRGSLKVEKHFDPKMNYALLNEEGRKIYLKARDERLQKTINHPILNRKISYGTLIKLDCYKLIKHLLGEKDFKPFNLKIIS